MSPESAYEGCAIYYQASLDLKAYKQQQWDTNFIFAEMHCTIIIVAYLNPNRKAELMEKLIWYIGNF